MPAKKIINKENIINAAFEIVRESSMDALNMRSVAKRCKCSTQPIYLSFTGIEELKREVEKKINEAFDKRIEQEIYKNKYPKYKAIGMGYIAFANEEKQLFKYLLMRNRSETTDWETQSFDKSTHIIMQSYGLYKDQASRMHAEMWIFVHGIATMIATGYQDWDMETVSAMLTDVYSGIMKNIQGEQNDSRN